MWPTTYYQPGTFLITSDTPVAAAQPGLKHGTQQSSAIEGRLPPPSCPRAVPKLTLGYCEVNQAL